MTLLLLVLAGCAGPHGDDPAEDTAASDTANAEPFADGLAARVSEDVGSVLYVSWNQLRPVDTVWVEWQVDPDTWQPTPARAGSVGAHEQIVLGAPFGAEVRWRVVSESGAQVDGPAVTTDPVPGGLPTPVLDISSPEGWEPGAHWLLTSVSEEEPQRSRNPQFWVVLLDRQARYVWAVPALPNSWTLYAKPSRDGTTILWDDDLYWTTFNEDSPSQIHQVRLDGSEVRVWDTPGLAHSFDDLDAETVVWDRLSGRDDEVVVSRGDAAPEVLWSCLDWIELAGIARDGATAQQCGANSIQWNPDRDTLTLSLWSHETVLELDHTLGEVLWFSDPTEGHGYAVEPEHAIWSWQHEATLLGPDRLLLSSGVGDGRGEGFDGTATYEYAIDHEAGTLELVWSYISEPEFAATYKGGATRLAGGNTVHWYGSGGGVKELTPAAEVVWQVQFENPETSWTGRSTWLDDLYAFAP